MKKMIQTYLLKKRLKKSFPKMKFGSNFQIEHIDLLRNLNIQGYCYVGANATWSLRGKITIGNNVILGPNSTIWPYNHNYNSLNYLPYGEKQEDIIKEIVVEDNVWIGMNVTLLAGVQIGEGAVIGANSVVSKDIPMCAIVAGNPATVIRYRDKERYVLLKKNNKLYLKHKYEIENKL